MRVVDAVDDAGVLCRPYLERLYGNGQAGDIRVRLREARRVAGGTGFQAVRIEAVSTRKRAVLVIERVVLVENNEYILDRCCSIFTIASRGSSGSLSGSLKYRATSGPASGLGRDGRVFLHFIVTARGFVLRQRPGKCRLDEGELKQRGRHSQCKTGIPQWSHRGHPLWNR